MTCCKCKQRISRTNTSVRVIGAKALCPDCYRAWGVVLHACWKEWLDA